MNKTQLKSFLNSLTREELVDIITSLHNLSKVNQDFLNNLAEPDSEGEIFKKYKSIIENEFFPANQNPKTRYSVAKKAIVEFKQIARNPENVAELMCFYVEMGVQFTNDYGDIDEAFYNAIANAFESALKYIFENSLEKKFKGRCRKLMDDSCQGWGFYDEMSEIYYDYYSFEEDED
jgi:hypothetical protein